MGVQAGKQAGWWADIYMIAHMQMDRKYDEPTRKSITVTLPEVPDRPVNYKGVIQVGRSKLSPCTWFKTVYQERRSQQSSVLGSRNGNLAWPGEEQRY